MRNELLDLQVREGTLTHTHERWGTHKSALLGSSLGRRGVIRPIPLSFKVVEEETRAGARSLLIHPCRRRGSHCTSFLPFNVFFAFLPLHRTLCRMGLGSEGYNSAVPRTRRSAIRVPN